MNKSTPAWAGGYCETHDFVVPRDSFCPKCAEASYERDIQKRKEQKKSRYVEIKIPNNCPKNRHSRKPEDIHTCGKCPLRQPADTTAGTVVLCPYQDAFKEGSEG